MSNPPPVKQEEKNHVGYMILASSMTTLTLGILLCVASWRTHVVFTNPMFNRPYLIGAIGFHGLVQFTTFMNGTKGASLRVRFIALFALWAGMLINAHYNGLVPLHSTLFITLTTNVLGAVVCAVMMYHILYFHADNKKVE